MKKSKFAPICTPGPRIRRRHCSCEFTRSIGHWPYPCVFYSILFEVAHFW